jgi:hypothetical protein
MTMSIYVAACREDVQLVREFQAKLREHGYTITHDWTDAVLAEAAKNRSDTDIPRAELREYAESDLYSGVLDADCFWLLAPAKGGTGCWIELGSALVALNLNKVRMFKLREIIVSGAHTRTIFTALDGVRCIDEHADALGYFVELARALASPVVETPPE